ncbi:MFS transporter [Chengkuizengella axinellae]|uniref:MFS transporter n=1 Tax=Chengkuizengella axinellae TaxID=3064388 RepID=A0ABT9J1P9_9BACL|nr:MFS transporter [Chengkuizengella sp. 2205SS18-9]MDP5275536.1 MFS transporter [Chengkuizengella sp. 2205SS18-9]
MNRTKYSIDSNGQTTFIIVYLMGFTHFLNDLIQAIVPALYPIMQESLHLSYAQIGLMGFTLSITAAIIQPFMGWWGDTRFTPYSLPLGMFFTLIGIIVIGVVEDYSLLLIGIMFIGVGSAVYHPEGSRVVYYAAGNKRGLSQSIFQVGGNFGQAFAPIMAALVFAPLGKSGALWFSIAVMIAMISLLKIASWYKEAYNHHISKKEKKDIKTKQIGRLELIYIFFILVIYIIARTWYYSGITSFYQFYIIKKYNLSFSHAQVYIFLFLFGGVLGTLFGGTLSDRWGRKNVMLLSMFGTIPFSLMLPYADPHFAIVLCFVIGFIMLSSFTVMVVYAQELIPNKIGTVTGIILGLAFGLGAIGSGVLGYSIEYIGLDQVMYLLSFLPFVGFLLLLLPRGNE